MVYKTDVDYSYVQGLDFDSLVKYIAEKFYDPQYPGVRSIEASAKIMRIISKVIGLNLSNEQYIFMLSNARRLLCEATAGAGKTTIAQLALIGEKIGNNTQGREILALAYNRSARMKMEETHTKFVRKINHLGIPDLKLDMTLSAKTLHSFCMEWLNEYYSRLGIKRNDFVQDDYESLQIIKIAAGVALKRYNKDNNTSLVMTDTNYRDLLKLYNFINETLMWDTPERWITAGSVHSLDVFPIELIQLVYRYFKISADAQGKYPYSDWMELMYQLLCDPEILKRIRANYKVILVDEYQDITPSMLKILKIFTEGDPEKGLPPYSDSRLICIGDTDQSIYRFRGTDPFNCLRFVDTYGDGKFTRIVSMSVNRRCRQNILDKAKKVIEANPERIDKPITAIKPGGVVNVLRYESLEQEGNLILSELKKISPDDYENTCICYRNNSSAMYVAMKLLERDIPFRIISGDAPFTDKLSTSIMDALDLLAHPSDKIRMKKTLYKLLPRSQSYTKQDILKIIDAAPEDVKFWELQYPNNNAVRAALQVLATCMSGIRLQSVKVAKPGVKMRDDDPSTYTLKRTSAPLSTYVDKLITLIEKFYFNFQNWDSEDGSSILSEEYLQYIKKYFTRTVTYEDLLEEQNRIIKQLSGEMAGLYLSSFHSLKGLEFKHVIAVDLDDTIFPGTDFKNCKDTRAAEGALIESETRRLLYVVCTRAIDDLTLCFSQSNPCRYIRYFTDVPEIVKLYNSTASDDGFVAAEDIVTVTHGNFVQDSRNVSAGATTGAFSAEDNHTDILDNLLDDEFAEDDENLELIGEDITKDVGGDGAEGEHFEVPLNNGETPMDRYADILHNGNEEIVQAIKDENGPDFNGGGAEDFKDSGLDLEGGLFDFDESAGSMNDGLDLEGGLFDVEGIESPEENSYQQDFKTPDDALKATIGDNMDNLLEKPFVRGVLGKICWTAVNNARANSVKDSTDKADLDKS